MPITPDLTGVALDGRYELHEIIGEGAFGRVYRGRDRRLARWVAVKVIKPWWAEDPEWAGTFEQEAQLLASISDPGIIQIFDVGAAEEGLYYVAELVEGESLAARLRRGPLAAEEARRVALQLARALARAHAQRVVHRDVKPANVLIASDGRVKVGDFGVARLAEGSTDGNFGTVAGTPGYMAPEQARGGSTTPATDVYGVGIVLYEMLAGRTPFTGSSAVELALAHVAESPPPLPRTVPVDLSRVVEQALAKDPGERFQDGAELAAALEGLAVAPDDVPRSSAPGVHRSYAGPSRPTGTLTRPQTVSGRTRRARGAGGRPDRRPNDHRGGIPRTRVGSAMSPRRNVNPSERRQRFAMFGLVAALAAGLGSLAIALAPGHVRVPSLAGKRRSQIEAIASRAQLKPVFSARHSLQPAGIALAQSPRAGARVSDGTTVRVVLSSGPPPVAVPHVIGYPESTARAVLGAVKLDANVTEVAAPGVETGTVTGQRPRAGRHLARGGSVALDVAEAPRLRPQTSFSGVGAASSVPFRIRGNRWEIVYSLAYQGTCTFIFWCSGPSAKVLNAGTGAKVDGFGLSEGGHETRIFTSGPGTYRIEVSPGSDSANWKIRVYDYY